MAIVNITGALNLNGFPVVPLVAPCAVPNLPLTAPLGMRGTAITSLMTMTAGIGQVVTGYAAATFDPSVLVNGVLSNGNLTASLGSTPLPPPALVFDGIGGASGGTSAYGSTVEVIPTGALAFLIVVGSGPTAFVDSAGNHYTKAIGPGLVAIWYCANCVFLPTGGTITATGIGSNYWAQIGYAEGYSALDQTNSGSGSASSASVSVTPGHANELALAALSTTPAAVIEGAGFTSLSAGDYSSSGDGSAYAVSSNPITYAPSWSGTQAYIAVVATFVPSAASANGNALSTTGYTTGKYHFEITLNVSDIAGNIAFGFANYAFNMTKGLGQDNNSFCIQNTSPVKAYFNNTLKFTAASGTISAGDIIAMEIDFGAKLFWYQNMTNGPAYWNANPAANPATGTNGISFSTMGAGPYYAAISLA